MSLLYKASQIRLVPSPKGKPQHFVPNKDPVKPIGRGFGVQWGSQSETDRPPNWSPERPPSESKGVQIFEATDPIWSPFGVSIFSFEGVPLGYPRLASNWGSHYHPPTYSSYHSTMALRLSREPRRLNHLSLLVSRL